MSKFEHDQFLSDLEKNLTKLPDIQHTPVNESMTTFINIFETTLQLHAPLRNITRKEKKLKRKPWITKGILTSIKHKNKLFTIKIKTNLQESIYTYKKYRNKLNHITGLSKKQYYFNLFTTCKNNSSKLWKTINDIVKYKKPCKVNHTSKIRNNLNEIIYEGNLIANCFNDFFADIGNKMASQISVSQQSYFPSSTALIPSNPNTFFLDPITINEVGKNIAELDPNKKTSIHGIPIKFIKMSSSIISSILKELFKQCICQATFPDILKVAEIVPIFKSGSTELCSNYRPISLLPTVSKLFEKCIYNRIYKFFDKFKLLSSLQFGFRHGKSTADAVLNICDEFVKNLDNKLTTCSIFIDLAKAFDSVSHNILIAKFEKYGIRGLPLQLIQDYLNNRKQYTVVSNAKSTLRNTTCGIPQGSTLGPLLFNIYINDLAFATSFNANLFADDTNLTLANKNHEVLEKEVNAELNKINNWMQINKLTINHKKTEFILITKKKINKFDIKINDITIKRKNSSKYLKIIIDDKLN